MSAILKIPECATIPIAKDKQDKKKKKKKGTKSIFQTEFHKKL